MHVDLLEGPGVGIGSWIVERPRSSEVFSASQRTKTAVGGTLSTKPEKPWASAILESKAKSQEHQGWGPKKMAVHLQESEYALPPPVVLLEPRPSETCWTERDLLSPQTHRLISSGHTPADRPQRALTVTWESTQPSSRLEINH